MAFASIISLVLFTKNDKLWNERIQQFLYIWLLQRITLYQKKIVETEVENFIFRHNRIFRHTCIYKQPILTKQWNYNIFVQILYSYLRYTARLLDVFFLLLTVIFSELHENPRRKFKLQKKVYRGICVRDIIFLAARPLLYMKSFTPSQCIQTCQSVNK